MRRISSKQSEYLSWLEQIARPYIIDRDGNTCTCCKRGAFDDEKLDIDHILGKGSHPELKKDLTNLRLLCRFPCHRNRTDHVECKHG